MRGTPQQIIDKYNQLARDAQLSNDRVAAENFQQHAEHYLRLLSEAQREIESRREEHERQNRERQADRDRERAERMEREIVRQADPVEAPRLDGMDFTPEAVIPESGLVETPENQGPEPEAGEREEKPRRLRTRKSRAAPAVEDASVDQGDAAKAAE